MWNGVRRHLALPNQTTSRQLPIAAKKKTILRSRRMFWFSSPTQLHFKTTLSLLLPSVYVRPLYLSRQLLLPNSNCNFVNIYLCNIGRFSILRFDVFSGQVQFVCGNVAGRVLLGHVQVDGTVARHSIGLEGRNDSLSNSLFAFRLKVENCF